MKIPYSRTKSGIAIRVKVQPRSSRKGLGNVTGDVLKVYLTSPPVDGAANDQLSDVLSDELGVKKSALRIVRGLSSREKTVEVVGVEKI